jgi:hypothetical protein
MKHKALSLCIGICITLIGAIIPLVGLAGNIDDTCKWSWGENIGWANFSSDDSSVTVNTYYLMGYVWANKAGWINLGDGAPASGEHYGNDSNTDFGVNNDGSGNLYGYGWGENIGWINFSSGNYPERVVIDDENGNFSGYGWTRKAGWVNFSSLGTVNYRVKTSWTPASPTPSVTPTPTPSVTPSVTPTPTPEVISVYLNMNDWDIGTIGLSETEESVEITATNDGNVTEDFTIYCENGAGDWTIQSAVGEDSFTVKADVFPYGGYDITLEDGASPVTLVTSVEAEDTVYFKLQYSAPSSNTKVSGIPQDFDITITAIKH